MISFHSGHLAPPELCELLYQVVDDDYHLPVVFHSVRDPERRGVLGMHNGERIEIHLDQIYRELQGKHLAAPSSYLWYQTLSTCLHEFGHAASYEDQLRLPTGAYHWDNRANLHVEMIAERWSLQKMCQIRDLDTRLGQPTLLRGYLGARLAKEYIELYDGLFGRRLDGFAKERRWLKTGAQLSSGDMLILLGLSRDDVPKAYQALRRVSEGVGITYIDRAKRRHRLYTWGDVPIIGKRLATSRSLTKLFTPQPRRYEEWPPIYAYPRVIYGFWDGWAA